MPKEKQEEGKEKLVTVTVTGVGVGDEARLGKFCKGFAYLSEM